MGMDVYGRKPTSETGNYFRNNVWWWRPLADFIINNYSDDIKRIPKIAWHTNDGEGLGARDSLRLANLLRRDLDRGYVAEFEKAYNAARESAAEVPCKFCAGSGRVPEKNPTNPVARKIEALQNLADRPGTPGEGVAAVAAITRLSKIVAQALPEQTRQCWMCNGKGTVLPWSTNYPFSVENVEEFEKFLRDSGGFRIH
jgi:hypothetical protein